MTPTGERVEQQLPLAEILDQVAAGQRCGLVDIDASAAAEAFEPLAQLAGDRARAGTHFELRWGNGAGDEQILHPRSGGSLIVGTADAFRGCTLDVAYAAVEIRGRHDVEVLVPALARTNGEIVWWQR